MNPNKAANLANQIVTDVNRYGFDGVNIDDEYSTCSGYGKSFYNVVNYIKTATKFQGKTISKDLWKDSQYFQGTYNIAPLLNQGYEMTYNGKVANLKKYVQAGMSYQNLFFGISPENNPINQVKNLSKSVISSGYQGMMIWAPNNFFANNTTKAANYYTNIAQGEYGDTEQVIFQQ